MNIDPRIPAQMAARLQAKAQPMLAACLGQRKTMRIDKKTTVSGVIVKAEIDSIEDWGRTARVIFKVTLECGAAKALREFRCQELPV